MEHPRLDLGPDEATDATEAARWDRAGVGPAEHRKDYDVPIDRLREQWRARAAEHGFGLAEIAEVVGRRQRFPAERLELARVAVDLVGPAGVTREHSTFDDRDAIQAWAERHRDGAPATTIENLAKRWMRLPDLVALKRGRYSTRQLLAIEAQMLQVAERRRGAGCAVASIASVRAAVAARATIATEQAALVERLVTSGAGVEVVRSPAGTGKTFALDAAREAWERDGIRVAGCALSARAALELRDHANIQSATIARLLTDVREGHSLKPGSVLVVDEAGMVGTRDLAELIAHAGRTNTKLLLVGDDRQLPEIEAGGAFRALAQKLGSLELRDVRRQHHAWDRAALAELRDGDPRRFVDAYRDHGRIVAAPTADRLREQLVADWWRDRRTNPAAAAVMVALRRSDVDDLNYRARAHMRDAGKLGLEQLEVAQRRFAVGDHVVATQNHQRLGLANGTTATVAAMDPATCTVTIAFPEGSVSFPRGTSKPEA